MQTIRRPPPPPIALLVREIVSNRCPPSADTTVAFFTVLCGKGLKLKLGTEVRLLITSVVTPYPGSPSHAKLLDIPVRGKIVDAKKMGTGVEYVVKNEYDQEASQVRFAYLRDPSAPGLPDCADFMRELEERVLLARTGTTYLWIEGSRVPVRLVAAMTPTNPPARPAKRLRARQSGRGADEDDPRATRKGYAPAIPSPLANGTAVEMEE